MAPFTGFPVEALEFYEGLEADNSRTYWQAHKAVYDQHVRGPMEALIAAFPEHDSWKVFRPYRDVRFSKDKTPYKTHIGAVTETEAGALFYVQLGAQGLFVAAGYHQMRPDQVERFRLAVADVKTGPELEPILHTLEKAGYVLGGEALKIIPRGYPKDHPRARWLRHKGLTAAKTFPLSRWLHTKAVVGRVRSAWADALEMNAWLDRHVGPSTLPPDER
jgi:uncharacterized protein (TIGR02453 family)